MALRRDEQARWYRRWAMVIGSLESALRDAEAAGCGVIITIDTFSPPPDLFPRTTASIRFDADSDVQLGRFVHVLNGVRIEDEGRAWVQPLSAFSSDWFRFFFHVWLQDRRWQ